MSYEVGTASFTNGSTTVTFSGSSPAPDVSGRKAGDIISGPDAVAVIASADSATQVTLVQPWGGATVTDAAYTINDGYGWSTNVVLNQQTQNLLNLIGGGQLLLPREYYSDTLSDRDAYDDVSPPFIFGKINGEDDVDVYFKVSSSSADWSAAVNLAGPTGASGSTGTQGPAGETGRVADSYAQHLLNVDLSDLDDGVYIADQYITSDGTLTRFHAEVLAGTGTGSYKVNVLVNDVAVHGPKTVTSASPVTDTDLSLSLSEGDVLEYDIFDVTNVSELWISADGDAATVQTVVAKTDNYTVGLVDVGKLLTLDAGTTKAFTIPPNSVVAFPLGSTMEFAALGTGTVNVTGGTGVTVNGVVATAVPLEEQFAKAKIIKLATDTWLLSGQLA